MDEAEEELLRGLALAPEDEELHRDLGTLYLETHRGPRAALHFARAAANAPDGVRAAKEFNLWATAELSDGRVPQALEALRRGMERDRTNKEVRERLAELLEKAALPEEAAQEWRALREGWPEEKRYHWRLTQALLMAKDTRGAFHAVERYLSLPLTRAERQEAETFRESLANAVDAPLSGTPPAAETVAPSSAPSSSANTTVEFSTAGASQ
jgi:tetratricopeptide (TPR) repeat protein